MSKTSDAPLDQTLSCHFTRDLDQPSLVQHRRCVPPGLLVEQKVETLEDDYAMARKNTDGIDSRVFEFVRERRGSHRWSVGDNRVLHRTEVGDKCGCVEGKGCSTTSMCFCWVGEAVKLGSVRIQGQPQA